jgi:RimJ/RimL family protein N-acetyltransferase
VGDPLDVAWPIPAIQSARLTIRPTEVHDRAGLTDLLTSAEVRRFLGGPLDRTAAESHVSATPVVRPGRFTVERDGRFIGTVMVDRRPASRPGHLSPGASEVEISYTFLPLGWGGGFATEAVECVLKWIARVLPGDPVVLCTQVANDASVRLAERVGFTEHQRFVEFGAEQWLGYTTP